MGWLYNPAADTPHESGRDSKRRLERSFLANLPLIEGVIRDVCNQHRMYGADAEDFGSLVKLKLIEDDYARLQKFEGRCSLGGYLKRVIVHIYLDQYYATHGKPRPSTAARMAGPVAIALERLIVRYKYSLDEAHETLRTSYQYDISRAEVERLVDSFPRRWRPVFVPFDESIDPPGEPPAFDVFVGDGPGDARTSLLEALDRAIAAFEDEERLILVLRFQDGHSVPRIAAFLGLDPKGQRKLYPRIKGLLKQLRKTLERQGFDRKVVRELLGGDRQ